MQPTPTGTQVSKLLLNQNPANRRDLLSYKIGTDVKGFCTTAKDDASYHFNPSGTQPERGNDLVKKVWVHHSGLT
jgi:hypothetical protein